MSNVSLGHLAFDRGIDSITYARQEGLQALPEREEAPPPDLGARPQVETLLSLLTLDDALESAIRPQLENRDLMVPARFRQALDDSLARLTEAAEQTQPAGGDSAGDGARVLNRAVRLLKEECGLRDLLQMYRSALYQG
jgi:type III secretion protein X